MARIWLCVTTPENFDVVKEKRVWGVEDVWLDIIRSVNIGDILVFYVMQEVKIKGIFRVESMPYYDEELVFHGNKVYPNRIRIRPLIILEDGIDFRKIVHLLSPFRKAEVWPVVIKNRAMIELTETDLMVIVSAITFRSMTS